MPRLVGTTTSGAITLIGGASTRRAITGVLTREDAAHWRNITDHTRESVPAGANSPWILARTAGGLGAHITGVSDLTVTMDSYAFLAAALAGSSSLDASSLTLAIRLAPSPVGGVGQMAAAMNSPAHLVCRIKIGADPGAEEIADAVWQRETSAHVDTGVMGGLLALLGKMATNKTVTDPTAGTITIYDADGVTPLLTAALFEDAAGAQSYRGQGADRRDRYA